MVINLEENDSGASVSGNYNSVKIGNCRANLYTDGNFQKIRVGSGNGHISFTGNYCCISIGPSMDESQVTSKGNYVEVRREAYSSC